MVTVSQSLKIVAAVTVILVLVGVYILAFGRFHPTPDELGDLRG